MKFVTKRVSDSFVGLSTAIAETLVDFGFTVSSINGVVAYGLTEGTPISRAVLNAPVDVDRLAGAQPWSIILEASANDSDAKLNYLDVFILPTVQITNDQAPNSTATRTVGKLSREALILERFIHLEESWGLDQGTEYAAHPVVMTACATDHGIGFSFNPDGLDNQGQAQSWFVVQRPVMLDGSVDNRAPLVCVYATCGGCTDGDPDVIDMWGTAKFFVHEYDVHVASIPTPAALTTPDNYPIINVLQQVCFTYDNRFLILTPQYVNSGRYTYPMQMDMLAYTSADALAPSSTVKLKLPFITDPVDYISLGASGNDNRGMRLLFPNY